MAILFYMAGVVAGIYFLATGRIPKRAAALMLAFSTAAAAMGAFFLITKDADPLSSISRMDKGGEDVVIDMEVEAFDSREAYEKREGQRSEMNLSVSAMEYDVGELMEMESAFWKELYPLIKGDNESLDHVDRPLNLPRSLDGYPFEVSYQSASTRILENDGNIGEEAAPGGSLVEIKAVITLEDQDFKAEEHFFAQVYPATDEESFFKRLKRAIITGELKNRNGRTYTLPGTFEGRYISYSKKVSDNSGLIFIVGIVAAAAIVTAEKKNEESRLKIRRDKMESEYPQVVSKISMLVGAGMTITGAYKKLAVDYYNSEERDRPLYDELLKTAREMDSGISERKAFRDMGNRCALPCVIRLGALLTQYSQSGASGLRAALAAETDQALKERRERAKRLGEEAGTKLLFPMVLMLLVVMVVIMIPAFTSFGI